MTVHKLTPAMQRRDAEIRQLLADGTFTVDDDGNVFANGRPQRTMNNGYLVAAANQCAYRAHRVVYLAKRGPIPAGHVINHIDGDKTNNRPGNLEAVTQDQNVAHARDRGHYRGLRPEDWAAIDPDFLAKALALKAQGATPDEAYEALCWVADDAEDPRMAELREAMAAPHITRTRHAV